MKEYHDILSTEDNNNTTSSNTNTDSTITNNSKKKKRRMRKKLSKTQEAVQWRRNKVLELYVSGSTETEIARTLQVAQSTVSVDLKAVKEQSKATIHNIIESEIPMAWAKARKALQYIQKEAIQIANDDKTNTPQRLAALALFKDTQESEFELITNSEILNDAFRFVEAHSKTVDSIKQALDQRDKEHRARKQDNENDTDGLSEHATENQEAA
jgi:hypothetical protein